MTTASPKTGRSSVLLLTKSQHTPCFVLQSQSRLQRPCFSRQFRSPHFEACDAAFVRNRLFLRGLSAQSVRPSSIGDQRFAKRPRRGAERFAEGDAEARGV